MAIEIPKNIVSDHVVFDRIVDADRTIKLAREAAAEAVAAGKQDVADMLNAKADALEKILLATQQPDYEDEEDPPPVSDTGDDNKGTQNEEEPSDNDNETVDDAAVNGGDNSTSDAEGKDSSNSNSGESGNEQEEKTPEDIADLNKHNGNHAAGTKSIGPKGSGGAGSGEADTGDKGESREASGKSKSNSSSKELDPFRMRQGGMGNGKQPTPEEILAAVIKRLNGLDGNAKTGADRALRKLFDELGGTGDIDD